VKHDAIPQLHQSIGPDYIASLVRPEIGSRMREVIADYTAEEVYSTKRQEIQDKIRGHAEAMLGGKMMERTAEESESGEHYRIPAQCDDQPDRHPRTRHGAAGDRGRRDQSKDRAILHRGGIHLPGHA